MLNTVIFNQIISVLNHRSCGDGASFIENAKISSATFARKKNVSRVLEVSPLVILA